MNINVLLILNKKFNKKSKLVIIGWHIYTTLTCFFNEKVKNNISNECRSVKFFILFYIIWN